MLLAATFLGMGVYGLFINKAGAAIISFLMVIFTLMAEKKFQEDERKWLADPRNAKTIRRADSLEALDAEEAEASGSRF